MKVRPKDRDELVRMQELLTEIRVELDELRLALQLPDWPPLEEPEWKTNECAWTRAHTMGQREGLTAAILRLEEVQSRLWARWRTSKGPAAAGRRW